MHYKHVCSCLIVSFYDPLVFGSMREPKADENRECDLELL